MTLAQIDALARVEDKAHGSPAGNGRDSRQWGSAADLLAFAHKG